MKNKIAGIREKILGRLNYVFIILGIVIAVGISVYALAPGIIPNPGHNISDMSAPSGCTSGQFLQYNSSNGGQWICSSICPPGTHVVASNYTNGLEDTYGAATSTGYASPCPSVDTCTGDSQNFVTYNCTTNENRTCTNGYKVPTGGMAPYTCVYRTVTCKKAAMLCGE